MEEKLVQLAEDSQAGAESSERNSENDSLGDSASNSVNQSLSLPAAESAEEPNEHKEPEKSSTWSVKLYEADRTRLMNLLDVIPAESRREAFMNIVAKAEVAAAREQAATGFVAELEKYTKAIMQSAVRQVSMFEAAEAAYKGEAQQRLDAESKAKEEFYAETKLLNGRIANLGVIIKSQNDKLDRSANELFRKQEEIDSLKADLETARRNVEAVAGIHKDYSARLKKAEAARAEAEADKLKAEAEAAKSRQEAEVKLKALSEDFEAFKKTAAEESSRLSSALSAAEAIAAAREAQITQLAAANAQLMRLLAAAQNKLGGAAGKPEGSVNDDVKDAARENAADNAEYDAEKNVEESVKGNVKDFKGKND